jgi:N-ethylmaleimide reductase
MTTNFLLNPCKLGSLELPNRIVMAPLTRCRADSNHVPTDIMATYYAQRATAGLIIAEATMAIEGNSAFWREPGIYSKAQIDGWKKVTDAVHEKGGKTVLQIWHGGRACHPLLNNGATPVAPSALRIENDEVHTPEGKKPYTVPSELTIPQIKEIVSGFKQAAMNAKQAGFDGIEVHAANGYLIDELLRDGSNKRTDIYGGALENRTRFLFEVVDAVLEVWDRSKVGVRISPLNSYNDMRDSEPVALTKAIALGLNERKIAYLHLMRGDFFGIQKADVVTPARGLFKGNLMLNGGFTPAEAEDSISTGLCDTIAFGHHYISNPDLVNRIKNNYPIAEPDSKTFYTQDEKGYTDYPNFA